jgi:hypothetical protein
LVIYPGSYQDARSAKYKTQLLSLGKTPISIAELMTLVLYKDTGFLEHDVSEKFAATVFSLAQEGLTMEVHSTA